jgi:hypothetical protein
MVDRFYAQNARFRSLRFAAGGKFPFFRGRQSLVKIIKARPHALQSLGRIGEHSQQCLEHGFLSHAPAHQLIEFGFHILVHW